MHTVKTYNSSIYLSIEQIVGVPQQEKCSNGLVRNSRELVLRSTAATLLADSAGTQ